jgi:acetoacetyl-CoA synthetase
MMGEMLRNPDSNKPSAATIDVLTQIWQRVLQRSQIGPEDRFYDVGGSDALADRLFVEIAGAFDRQLPTATICHAPSITALAALLEQSAPPLFSPFVKLKPGSDKMPILIAHGLGGRASFSELAKHIRTEHVIYGIQAKGVDGMEEPFDRIEDMAEFYLKALSRLQSQGSYILMGYSFGGLIALEMAQRLSAEGKKISLLALVDTYPHPRYLPWDQRVWLGAKRIKGHISDLKRKPLDAAFSQVLGALKSRLPIPGARKPRALPAEAVRLSFAETIAHVKASDLLAMRRYRPRFYRGKMIFVRPEANSYLPTDPTAVWENMATEFQVYTVPGDHLGMIAEHFESLAAVLTDCVREASRE